MPEWVISLLGGGALGGLALAMKKVIVVLIDARKARIGAGADVSRAELERLGEREERIFVEANRRIDELKSVVDRLDETVREQDSTIDKLRDVAEDRRVKLHDYEHENRTLMAKIRELEALLARRPEKTAGDD